MNFDNDAIRDFIHRVIAERERIGSTPVPVISLWDGANDIVSLRSTLLFGLKGMSAYAHHARNLSYENEDVNRWFYKGLCEVNREHTVEEWIALIMEFGQVNFKCMELLDTANTKSFGTPEPRRVHTDIRKGPFIVVSGHDLKDMAELLAQTEGTGINVYTHCEMLPAHGYPVEYLSAIRNGDCAYWKYFDFTGMEVNSFICKTWGKNAAGTIEIRLDKPDGELIGTCELQPMNGDVAYSVHRTKVKPVTGVHALVLVFKNNDPSMTGQDFMNLEWFMFKNHDR